jgi:hypothetical protein
MYYVFSLLILGAIGALALAGCGGSSTNVAQDTETQGAALAAAEALGYIPSSKAGEHMGEEGTVRGSVKDYNYISGAKGRPYILIFDKPGIVKRRAAFGDLEVPESFKVVIWKDYHKNFPANFAGAYVGHTVCATGLIVDYNGDPAIEAHDPSQLKIDC